MKSGFVSIIGRPNTGKSTLLNQIIKEKVAIISQKPQTTRNLIEGIYNEPDTQIVFVDTPGIHKPIDKLGNALNSQAYYSINDVDILLLVVDASTNKGKGDEFIISKLQNINKPNKNTIEFRMANGEIDFDELLANINLFAKLIQVSHDLNTLDKDDERIKIAKSICTIKDELEKLQAFLDLLFDNEELKQIYYERYITNTLVMELLNEEIIQDNEYYIALDNESKLIRTK